ncbi:MAG: ankyrin repeat domain-containing protein, partial [Verrucomicrobiales bacterium]|nr:ankyrin repeat domain-containing protein [Verrucomicrobiales bacterium]
MADSSTMRWINWLGILFPFFSGEAAQNPNPLLPQSPQTLIESIQRSDFASASRFLATERQRDDTSWRQLHLLHLSSEHSWIRDINLPPAEKFVRELVEAGISLHDRNEEGRTPLLHAVRFHNSWMIRILARLGVKPDEPGNSWKELLLGLSQGPFFESLSESSLNTLRTLTNAFGPPIGL